MRDVEVLDNAEYDRPVAGMASFSLATPEVIMCAGRRRWRLDEVAHMDWKAIRSSSPPKPPTSTLSSQPDRPACLS